MAEDACKERNNDGHAHVYASENRAVNRMWATTVVEYKGNNETRPGCAIEPSSVSAGAPGRRV